MSSVGPNALRGQGASSTDPVAEPSLLPAPATASPPAGRPVLYLDLESDGPLPEIEDAPPTVTAPAGQATGMFWLDGDALMCACPDCVAPMSVRLWLMIAECWRCGTIIELTQEQEREAMRLLHEREQAIRRQQQATSDKLNPTAEPRPRPATPSAPAAAPVPAPPPPPPPVRDKQSPRPQAPPAPAPRERTAPVMPPGERRRAVAARTQPQTSVSAIGTTGVWLQRAFRDMPAWMVSMIIHFVLLTLLGLLTYGSEEDRSIILSTVVSSQVRHEGEENVDPSDHVVFDLPLPDQVNMDDPKQRETMVKAAEDAKQLQIDPNTIDPQLPDLKIVQDVISRGGTSQTALIARDPRVRVEMVKREGGTTLTEAAVSRGLRWLALNQHKDGRWKLHDLPHASGGEGHMRSDTAATSLALLPFLGAGQTHLVGAYQDHVSQGLRWLLTQQKKDGDLRGNSQGHSGMYAHGQSAIVLCEAYAMTRDEALREPAQKSIDFIVAAQHPGGGWRYEPGQAGDTSVLGWQLMALKSAQAAGLNVPSATMENAGHYLDTVASHGNARYGYQRGNQPTHVMTAEALLCRIYLGWRRDEPGLVDGVAWLAKEYPPDANRTDIYYWYYATQTMRHFGGPTWDDWNLQMREALVSMQDQSGKNAGSWPPRDQHASTGGRIYTTSLAVCTLEIYYRYLPVFQRAQNANITAP